MRICLEGLMGVGKSSLCFNLPYVFAPEPDFGGFGSGFVVEVKYLMERHRLWRGISEAELNLSLRPKSEKILYDRSCWSSEVFWRVGTFFGDISVDESKLLHQIWDTLRPKIPTPDCIIYLDAPIHVAVDRIKKRGSHDADVDVGYLARMKSEYELWLMHQELEYKTPILRYDVGLDMTEDEQKQFARSVLSDIKQIPPPPPPLSKK